MPEPRVSAGAIDETLVAVPGEPPVTTGARTGAPTSTSGPGATGASPSFAPSSGERQLLAGRYEILALIGAGGMGTVYRARDLELEELVALKVLRRELVEAPGILDRFRREVKLARRVTHRNVARVFDIGEHAGEKFLTMELVDGEALSAVIAREGAMPAARAGAIAHAVAEGLGAAHEAGVVHRDLKPDNVLLARDGRVVVTDFGIARAAAGAAGAAQTMGMLLGTPAYMAPEQVEGRAEIDARADVYAFGALLYELITGARAWPGESPFAVASARLVAQPPDPRARRPAIPDAMAELILRCLGRRPEERPASMVAIAGEIAAFLAAATTTIAPASPRSMHDVGFDLGSARAPAAEPAEKTVAVLPFRNTGAPDDEYFAEELTDDLIDALSMTRGLKVRARGSVARFKGGERDPREIGKELAVQVVVEGTVRKARGQVRISARLTSVVDGFQLWAKRFDRPEQDVLSINDEVARSIADALTLDRAAEARAAPSDPVALDLYIRGKHELRQFWPEHVVKAVALFEQALAIAPDDPLLLSGLATALARRSFFAGDGDFLAARRIAQQAVTAAPHLGEAQLALGVVHFHTGEPVAAARALRAAVSHSPGLAEAHAASGRLLVEAGAVEEGIRRLEAALAIDPDAPSARQELGRALALCGEWDRAYAQFEELRVRDDEVAFWTMRARMAMWRREPALAEVYLRRLHDDDRTMRMPSVMLAVVSGRQRVEDLAANLDAVAEAGTGGLRRRAFFYQLRAEFLGYFGHVPGVVDSVEKALSVGLIDRLWMDRCPVLSEARDHPAMAPHRAELNRRADAILAAYRTA